MAKWSKASLASHQEASGLRKGLKYFKIVQFLGIFVFSLGLIPTVIILMTKVFKIEGQGWPSGVASFAHYLLR